MKNRLLFVFLLVGTMFLQSCNEEEIPSYNIIEPVIDTSEYTGRPVTLLYSLDDGLTFSATAPTDIREDRLLLVKVNNGEEDVTKEDYVFDWSESSPKPASASSDLATFLVNGNINIKLKLKDVLVLVGATRSDGKFYSINPVSGVRFELFTPTLAGAPLTNVRAFLHHPKENKYYASVAGSGSLYTIDPVTKAATLINPNNGTGGHAVWNDVSNWLVAPDDSLLSVGDFGADGVGLVKFGTTGARGKLTTKINVCCELGLTWGADKSQVLVSNGNGPGPGEIQLDAYTVTGQIRTRQSILNFRDFPENLASRDLALNSMAKDESGRFYGILTDKSTGVNYFVRIFTLSGSISYIATLSSDGTQFGTLAFIPKHLL